MNNPGLTVFGYQIMGIETTKEKESLDDIIWSMGGALYAGPGAGASIQINVSELLRILEILPEKQEYENCE